MPTRARMWDALGGATPTKGGSAPAGSPVYDVLVVGGGITGAGIARDAARRGLKTALVEMRDLAFGTSSRSSKLVHGGLRYLEQGEISLVFEAVSERRILMDIAPHLVNPLAFLFPVYKKSRRGLWMVNAGMWLYDGLSLFRSPKLHRTLKPDDVRAEEPALDATDLTGAPLYYDCSTDDARLTLETALDAAQHGAVIATWAKVAAFVKDGAGRVVGATVEDAIGGTRREIRASAVVNATGPWTDQTVALASGGKPHLLRPTKGVHIVVDHAKLPVQHAVVAQHPRDKRVLFAIPWGDRTYVGTTDTDHEGDPAEIAATRADVDYLLETCAVYFPRHPLGRGDVISTWAGLRPLMAPPSDQGLSASSVSREHQIVVGQDGLVTIAGGKLTTYRRMAAEVVDTAVNVLRLQGALPGRLRSARTDEDPLPGAVGWPEDDDHAKVGRQVEREADGHLDAARARHLADTYGMRALEVARRIAKEPGLAEPLVEGRPEVLAQVDHAVEQELAARLPDVMVRRTQLFYRDPDQGLVAAGKVADRMARLLGWDDERRAAELALYEQEVARSRRWRAGT